MFVAAHGYDASPFDGETNLLLVSNGDGTYADRSSTLPQTPDFSHSACLGDVDGDGWTDLMILSGARLSANGVGLQVLINRRDGTFADETAKRLPGTVARDDGPWCPFIRFVDLDGDGIDDFYCDPPTWQATYPRYWLARAPGIWEPVAPSTLPREATTGFVFALDLDGDGQPDLVQVGSSPSGGIQYASLRNHAPRTAPIPRYVVEFHNASLDHYFRHRAAGRGLVPLRTDARLPGVQQSRRRQPPLHDRPGHPHRDGGEGLGRRGRRARPDRHVRRGPRGAVARRDR